MTEPTVAVVYDADGREHHTSSSSQFLRDGLANGELTTEPPAIDEPAETEGGEGGDENGENGEEGTDGSEVPAPGDDQHAPRQRRGRRVDGKPEDDSADGGH